MEGSFRAFFKCGASLWVTRDLGDGAVQMVAKGCEREWDEDPQPPQQ